MNPTTGGDGVEDPCTRSRNPSAATANTRSGFAGSNPALPTNSGPDFWELKPEDQRRILQGSDDPEYD